MEVEMGVVGGVLVEREVWEDLLDAVGGVEEDAIAILRDEAE